MFKRTLALVSAMLLSLATYAIAAELRGDHPDTYVVRKGDTLWDISARFLKQPWLWPEIWQANPQVHNPHLIYPGDVLNLAYANGRPSLSVSGSGQEESFGPHVRAEAVDDAIKPVPLSAIEDFLKKPRIVGEDEFKHAPHIVGIEDHH